MWAKEMAQQGKRDKAGSCCLDRQVTAFNSYNRPILHIHSQYLEQISFKASHINLINRPPNYGGVFSAMNHTSRTPSPFCLVYCTCCSTRLLDKAAEHGMSFLYPLSLPRSDLLQSNFGFWVITEKHYSAQGY